MHLPVRGGPRCPSGPPGPRPAAQLVLGRPRSDRADARHAGLVGPFPTLDGYPSRVGSQKLTGLTKVSPEGVSRGTLLALTAASGDGPTADSAPIPEDDGPGREGSSSCPKAPPDKRGPCSAPGRPAAPAGRAPRRTAADRRSNHRRPRPPPPSSSWFPPAACARFWRLADASGQVWEHTNAEWLTRRWVASRNQALKRPPARIFRPVVPPATYTTNCANGRCYRGR